MNKLRNRMGDCLCKTIDPSTPSMRKGRDGEKEKKISAEIVATNVVASRPSNADRLTPTV